VLISQCEYNGEDNPCKRCVLANKGSDCGMKARPHAKLAKNGKGSINFIIIKRKGNQFGSKGAKKCVCCRQQKKKVWIMKYSNEVLISQCEYTNEDGKCQRCIENGEKCGPKLTLTEMNAVNTEEVAETAAKLLSQCHTRHNPQL